MSERQVEELKLILEEESTISISAENVQEVGLFLLNVAKLMTGPEKLTSIEY